LVEAEDLSSDRLLMMMMIIIIIIIIIITCAFMYTSNCFMYDPRPSTSCGKVDVLVIRNRCVL
jgi:hypothetical protein